MIACESDKASEGTVLLGRRLPSEFFDATLQPTSARQLKTCRPQRTEVWSARWLQLCALGDLWITTPLFRTPMRCQVTVQISDCLTPRMRCRISSCKSREWLSRLHTAGLFFHGTSPEVYSRCPRSNLKNTSSINHTVKIRHSQNASCSRPMPAPLMTWSLLDQLMVWVEDCYLAPPTIDLPHRPMMHLLQDINNIQQLSKTII